MADLTIGFKASLYLAVNLVLVLGVVLLLVLRALLILLVLLVLLVLMMMMLLLPSLLALLLAPPLRVSPHSVVSSAACRVTRRAGGYRTGPHFSFIIYTPSQFSGGGSTR